MTVHIAIGNSDDKLTQRKWSRYIKQVDDAVSQATKVRHGLWLSASDAPWQNACWAIEPRTDLDAKTWLKQQLAFIAEAFDQDAIAWNESETEFMGPKPPAAKPPLGKVPVYSQHDHTAEEHCHPHCPRWEYAHERGVVR